MLKIPALFLLLLSVFGCALNTADGPLGELKGGKQSNDPDYYVNLWPETPDQEPNPLLAGELKGWPSIDKKTVLYVGDESLQGNWGLVLNQLFSEVNSNNLTLSACGATAQTWKSGGPAQCMFQAPFTKFKEQALHLTQDFSAETDRALPLILGHKNINKIILSFGYYLKDISEAKDLQAELVAIEILAKWAHSAGKTCYFVSPASEYFLETGNDHILPQDLTKRLEVLISPYCYWVDAAEARSNFLSETNIDVDSALKDELPEASQASDYIKVDESSSGVIPELPPLQLPTYELDTDTDIPAIENYDRPPRRPETSGDAADTSTTTTTTTTDAGESGSANANNSSPRAEDSQEQTEEAAPPSEASTPEEDVAERLRNLEPADIPLPIARPKFLSEEARQDLRQQIEQNSGAGSQAESRSLTYQEPKYLWNAYAQGSRYTNIGKTELESYGKSMFETNKLSDATQYCPNYWNLSREDKKRVWLFLYSAMALYESSFKSTASATEVTGGTSIGLFQMDYNNCKQSARNAQDLKDPRINFRCAIRKSAFLVREGGQIANGSYPSNCNRQGCKYRGGAMDRFWSTLRNPYNAKIRHKGKLVNVRVGKRPQVKEHLKGLPHCKK